MPAKTNVQDILDKMEWVKRLPDQGGAWGRGLLSTAQSIAQEVAELEQQRLYIGEQIRDRTALLRMLPGRADRESPLMFDVETVTMARPHQEAPDQWSPIPVSDAVGGEPVDEGAVHEHP